jgi:glycine/D-amino acid oxidase-like deaminating enzyme
VKVDAIVIGAGVIGAAIAFELCKRGYRTLNVDKLSAAGYGPTSNSCAIVRAHYSSREGVAMAYEGFFYWQNWERYLGVADESASAKYMQSGTILLKSRTGHHHKVLGHYRDLGVEFEEWDVAELRRRVPIVRPAASGSRGAHSDGQLPADRRASASESAWVPFWPRPCAAAAT